MKVTFSPYRAHGEICAPPSKSYAHRQLICAALSEGKSVVRGLENSEDIDATTDCIKALGATVKKENDGTLHIKGGIKKADEAVFGCRESGSTLRFFLPLALLDGKPAIFTGTERLMQRGIGIYEDIFREKGITVEKNESSLKVSGVLRGGKYEMKGNVSSQFATGLLFALPLVESNSELHIVPPVESRGYIDITLDVLQRFGIKIEETEPNTFKIKGNQKYRAEDVEVEKDWSNAAFLFALNEVGGNVKVNGLSETSLQADKVCTELFEKLRKPNAVIDVSGCPDLAPVLFAVAAAKHGAKFTGTRRLKIKESDRAEVMAEELAKFGVRVETSENEATVFSNGLSKPKTALSGHNDHRIVMALSVIASVTGGKIVGAEAVAKSYPRFFEDLEKLGAEAKYEI